VYFALAVYNQIHHGLLTWTAWRVCKIGESIT